MTGDGKPPRRQELRTGGEVGLIQALGGREQSRAPYRETQVWWQEVEVVLV